MEEERRLELLGITFNQVDNGVYGLILEEPETRRRLPIVIGVSEAQSIQCVLQGVRTPRPLTHDIMVTMLQKFSITLERVEIKRLPNGVFGANLYLRERTGDMRREVIDSRSSDAVALAIRVGAPIYTTEEVLRQAAVTPEEGQAKHKSSPDSHDDKPYYTPPKAQKESEREIVPLEEMPTEELEKLMAEYAQKERYEEAAAIKEELERRKRTEP